MHTVNQHTTGEYVSVQSMPSCCWLVHPMDWDVIFFTLFFIFRDLFISIVSITSVCIILIIGSFIATSLISWIQAKWPGKDHIQTSFSCFLSCLLSLSLSSSCLCCLYPSEWKRSLFSIIATNYKTKTIKMIMLKLTLMIFLMIIELFLIWGYLSFFF